LRKVFPFKLSNLEQSIAGKHMLLWKKNGFPSIFQCAYCRVNEGANAHMVARPNSKAHQPVISMKAEPHGSAQGCSWNLHQSAIYFHFLIACLLTFHQ
jgi:hypothetical protein